MADAFLDFQGYMRFIYWATHVYKERSYYLHDLCCAPHSHGRESRFKLGKPLVYGSLGAFAWCSTSILT
jgi:hypothetical protein